MTRSYCADTLYKIGTDPVNMPTLKQLGVPVPDQVTYQAASVYYVRGDMSRIGDGYALASWVWDVISIEKLSKITSLLSGADYVNLYIRTDIRDGTFSNAAISFKVFSAMLWKPLLFGEDGNPIVRTPYAMQSVKLQFVNLVEMVGPSYL